MSESKTNSISFSALVARVISLLLAFGMLAVLVVYAIQLNSSANVLSKTGSKGNEVRLIQQRLKEEGLLSGSVDGIFGVQTKNALVKFQQKKGLTADGAAGPATLKALGVTGDSQQTGAHNGYSTGDINLLSNIISAEARGEPFEGQVAVGALVLNRVEHPSFPDTLAGVVYQPGAFTAVVDGQIDEPVSESARKAAREAFNGSDPSGGALYYFNPDKTSNKWMRTRPVIKRIGAHLFCS